MGGWAGQLLTFDDKVGGWGVFLLHNLVKFCEMYFFYVTLHPFYDPKLQYEAENIVLDAV